VSASALPACVPAKVIKNGGKEITFKVIVSSLAGERNGKVLPQLLIISLVVGMAKGFVLSLSLSPNCNSFRSSHSQLESNDQWKRNTDNKHGCERQLLAVVIVSLPGRFPLSMISTLQCGRERERER